MMSEASGCCIGCSEQLQKEFRHVKSGWWWLLLYGILLTVCGAAAVIFPALTVFTTFFAVMVLGIVAMIAGAATIVTALWADKWSGVLVQLLVGILYVLAGFLITESPVKSAVTLTLIVAVLLIVIGLFRSVAALVVRFPYWGWALLNGVITLLLGLIICRHFTSSGIWVLGLLIGLEMLFHGWNWIVIALAVRKIPNEAA